MAAQIQFVREWVLGELGNVGVEGIRVPDFFDQAGGVVHDGQSIQNSLWETLVEMEEVVFREGTPLSSLGMKTMPLQAINFLMAEKMIRLKTPAEVAAEGAKGRLAENESVVQSIEEIPAASRIPSTRATRSQSRKVSKGQSTVSAPRVTRSRTTKSSMQQASVSANSRASLPAEDEALVQSLEGMLGIEYTPIPESSMNDPPKAVEPVAATQAMGSQPAGNDIQVPSSDAAPLSINGVKRPAAESSAEEPPKKRRGRPPKASKDAPKPRGRPPKKTSAPPVSSDGPKRRGRPRKIATVSPALDEAASGSASASRAPSGFSTPQEFPSMNLPSSSFGVQEPEPVAAGWQQSVPASIVPSSRQRVTRSASGAASNSRPPPASQSVSPAIVEEPPFINNSAIPEEPEPMAQDDEDGETAVVDAHEAEAEAEALEDQLQQEASAAISANAAVDALPSMSTVDPSPPESPRDIRLRQAPNQTTLDSEEPTDPSPRKTKHAKFVSQLELDREQGISGIYIDPAGLEKPDHLHGRHKKGMMAVVRSDKLHDPEFLENNRGSWIEPVSKNVTRSILEAVDNAAPPPPRAKRPSRPRVSRAEQAARARAEQEFIKAQLERTASQIDNIMNNNPLPGNPFGFSPPTHTNPTNSREDEHHTVQNAQNNMHMPPAAMQPSTLPAMGQQRASGGGAEYHGSDFNRPTNSYPSPNNRGFPAGNNPYSANTFRPPSHVPSGNRMPFGPQGSSFPQSSVPPVFDPGFQRQHEALHNPYAQPNLPPPPPIGGPPASIAGFSRFLQVSAPSAGRYQSPYASGPSTSAPSVSSPSNAVPSISAPPSVVPSAPATGSSLSSLAESAAASNTDQAAMNSLPDGGNNEQRTNMVPSLSLVHSEPVLNEPQSSETGHMVNSAVLETPILQNASMSNPLAPQRVVGLPRDNFFNPVLPVEKMNGFSVTAPSNPALPVETTNGFFGPAPSIHGGSSETRNPPPMQPQPSKRKRPRVTGDVAAETNIAEPPTKRLANGPSLEQAATRQVEGPLSEAANVPFSPDIVRLPCFHNGHVGNLIISEDKSFLDFRPLDQSLPQEASVVIPLTAISGNPILSMPGSDPMEIIISAIDAEGEKNNLRFHIGSTPLALHSAHDMRFNISQLLTVSKFQNGTQYQSASEAAAVKQKPFGCDKCGKRWLNLGGLQYHLDKSQTACNPNFDISTLKPKPEKKKPEPKPEKKKSASKPVSANKKASSTKKPLARTASEAAEETVSPAEELFLDNEPDFVPQEENDSEFEAPRVEKKRPIRAAKTRANPVAKPAVEKPADAGNESDASIIEWAQQNAVGEAQQTGPAKPKPEPKKKKSTNSYRNLPKETLVLEIVEADLGTSQVDVPPGDEANGIESTEVVSLKELSERRKAAVMSIVKAHDGLFPADSSVWIAYVDFWIKEKPRSPQLPETRFLQPDIDEMVKAGLLHRIHYVVYNSRNREVKRSILHLPEFDTNDARIEQLKKKIQEKYPYAYVPEGFTPSEGILFKLQAVASKTVDEAIPELAPALPADPDPEPEEPRKATLVQYSESEDDFFTPEGDEGSVLDEDEEEEMEIEDDLAVSTTTSRRSSTPARPKSANGKFTRAPRSEHTKALVSAKLKVVWAERKAAGLNSLSDNVHQVRKTVQRKKQKPRTPEEKALHARQKALQLRSWGHAPTYLPSEENGAWDVQPDWKKTKNEKPHLPEPITFLQDEKTGAWSVRAFGHGVTPIVLRPGRVTHGNPNYEQHVKRQKAGFRPVILPNLKNRVQGPAPLSKRVRITTESPAPEVSDAPVRLSKATGKPVRNYTRKAQLENSVRDSTSLENDDEGVRTSKRTGKPTRGYTRTEESSSKETSPEEPESILARLAKGKFTQGLTEAQIVQFVEPKKLLPGAPRNPGLETIPSSFGLKGTKQAAETEDSQFPSKYDEIRFVEADTVHHPEFDPVDSSWTVNQVNASETGYTSIIWQDGLAFDMETIPYAAMDESEDVEPPKKKQRLPNGFYKSAKGKKTLADKARHMHQRIHTALADDFKGVLPNPMDGAKIYSVEIAPPNANTKDRRRCQGDMMTPEIENRLLVTCVVIKVLCGGLAQVVDWVLVSQLFQDFSIHFLKKQWTALNKTKLDIINQITSDFQEAFPVAYHLGEVPTLNYNNLVGYEWKKVVQWTMKNVAPEFENKPMPIPDNMDELHEMYDITKVDRYQKSWRETFFGLHDPVYKRVQAAASDPSALPIARRSPDAELSDLDIAKTWVRATALTPPEHWSIQGSNTKLQELGEYIVSKALEALIESKHLKSIRNKGAVPGRPYDPTDAFMSSLRKHLKMAPIIQAAQFKKWLDEQFRTNGGGPVVVDYMANDGAILAITSLVAAERITLNAPIVPMNKFGLTGGGYETRQIPRERIQFDIEMIPTETYLFDTNNNILHTLHSSPPPNLVPKKNGPLQPIPFWFAITGQLIDELWCSVLVAVCGMLVLRAGMGLSEMKQVFGPALEGFDLKLLVEWCEKRGLFVRLDDRVEGWGVGEWWWIFVGETCEKHFSVVEGQKETIRVGKAKKSDGEGGWVFGKVGGEESAQPDAQPVAQPSAQSVVQPTVQPVATPAANTGPQATVGGFAASNKQQPVNPAPPARPRPIAPPGHRIMLLNGSYVAVPLKGTLSNPTPAPGPDDRNLDPGLMGGGEPGYEEHGIEGVGEGKEEL